MVQGSVFTLFMNDGKDDALITQVEQMQKRLGEIRKESINKCFLKWNAYFNNPENARDRDYSKDYASWIKNPMQFCYDRTRSIEPIFEELNKTHTVYINRMWKPMMPLAYTYLKVAEADGSKSWNNTITFKVPPYATFLHQMFVHIRLDELRATNPTDKVKYCAWPGHRILRWVRFLLNKVVIDEYPGEFYNKYYQFDVANGDRQGWTRAMGQEIPHVAYLTPNPLADEYREYRLFADGHQTLKNKQEPLDMIIPLLFWFNLELGQAFPQCKIPKGTLEIQLEFADSDPMYAVADYGGGGGSNPPRIVGCDLYVQHISAPAEVEELVKKNFSFSLIRTHRTHEAILDAPAGEIRMNELKNLAEHMTAFFRPTENYNDVDYWNANNKLTPVNIYVPTAVLPPNSTPVVAVNQAFYTRETSVVKSLRLQVKDIDIYPEMDSKLYNSYFPLAAPGLNTPTDQGWFFIPLSFYPKCYNPSGHLNLSRVRDLRLNYTSDIISSSAPAKFTIFAQCINFLHVHEDGHAILRFL